MGRERVMVHGQAGIRLDRGVVFLDGAVPCELWCGAGAEIVIGPMSVFGHGVSIVAHKCVRIGARCRFGPLVQVRDDDGRGVAAIFVADDVRVGHRAIIEPGSTIREGSVVAAGALVRGIVPPTTLVIGNPARCVPLESRGSPASRIEAAAHRPTAGARYSRDEVRSAIIEWLDDTRHFGEAASLVRSDSMSLREGGLLDSLGLVQLVLMLEKRFGVTIERNLVSRPDCQTIDVLAALVTRHPASGP
jgi:acetyltransferase-like isoleucine patch superfamily enzyme/acyl carrier protein